MCVWVLRKMMRVFERLGFLRVFFFCLLLFLDWCLVEVGKLVRRVWVIGLFLRLNLKFF